MGSCVFETVLARLKNWRALFTMSFKEKQHFKTIFSNVHTDSQSISQSMGYQFSSEEKTKEQFYLQYLTLDTENC